jgi:zinc/manganese transport system permease protein
METIIFLSAPFTACLLMVAMLSYFGNHILTRGVIFIDIAVAQVAALGTMIAILLNFDQGSNFTFLFSLGFTIIVISLFALTKFKHRELSQEVIIGIIYCVALAAAMLLADSVLGGSNYIQKTMSGAILWVTWKENLFIFISFIIVGFIHFLWFDQFIKISEGKTQSLTAFKLRWLEMVFYVSFGIAVVLSVRIGGIFVVFMYLISPAATVLFFTDNWKIRIVGSWIIGFIGSVIGVVVSYQCNCPNGPTIVCVLGLILALAAIITHKTKIQTI